MTEPRIIPRAEHPISRGYIDPDALKVLYRLHRAGYKAYLVGGSVRDLLTGRTPKDFDIGTDARPQDVRRLFRNCRVIGRRFRLAHVLFDGGKIVEVSTFRRRPEPGGGRAGADGRRGPPDPLGQHLRHPRRGRRPARLHDQRPLLRHRDVRRDRLRRRRRRPRAAPRPDDRRRRDPLPRGPGPDDAGLRVRGAARLRDDPGRSRGDRREPAGDPEERRARGSRRSFSTRSAAGGAPPPTGSGRRRGSSARSSPTWTARSAGRPGARGLFWKMLAETDRRRAGGEVLSDAILLGVVFLPLLFAAIRTRSGGSVDAQKLLLLLEDVVNPSSIRLSLPNAAIHDLKQGLFTMGRLAELRPGDPAARRLVTKDYFPVAVSLLSLYAAASDRYREAAATWEDVLAARRRGGSAARRRPPDDDPVPRGPRPARPAPRPARDRVPRRRAPPGRRGPPAAPAAEPRRAGAKRPEALSRRRRPADRPNASRRCRGLLRAPDLALLEVVSAVPRLQPLLAELHARRGVARAGEGRRAVLPLGAPLPALRRSSSGAPRSRSARRRLPGR